MKLLVVSPYPTVPDHVGGKVRVIQLARSLGHLNIDVAVLEPYVFGRVFHPRYPEITSFRRIKYPFLAHYLFTDRPFPYQFLASFHPGYALMARRNLAGFDAYQFEHASFADLLDVIPTDKPVVYDAHNVEYDYVSAECGSTWVGRIARSRIYKLEKRLVERAAYILACSERDRQRFVELYGIRGDKIKVVPNGIRAIAVSGSNLPLPQLHGFDTAPIRSFKQRALFSGSDVQHNRAAVGFIVDVLAPRLGGKCAFIIKGACGTKFWRRAPDNVFFDTQPGSIDRLASISSVAINPVVHGSGTNLKLIDYVAHGLPVVTTEFGIRGYDDLRPFVTVCGLDAFADELSKPHVLPCAAFTELQKYLWPNLAKSVATLYAELMGVSVG